MAKKTQKQDLVNSTPADKVFLWLEKYIQKNQLQNGDALPFEEVIVEETGVSRTAVREALHQLRSLGIIESKNEEECDWFALFHYLN